MILVWRGLIGLRTNNLRSEESGIIRKRFWYTVHVLHSLQSWVAIKNICISRSNSRYEQVTTADPLSRTLKKMASDERRFASRINGASEL